MPAANDDHVALRMLLRSQIPSPKDIRFVVKYYISQKNA